METGSDKNLFVRDIIVTNQLSAIGMSAVKIDASGEIASDLSLKFLIFNRPSAKVKIQSLSVLFSSKVTPIPYPLTSAGSIIDFSVQISSRSC